MILQVFLKEKRNGYTKGSECAYGRKQQRKINYENAVPLIVSTEPVIITVAVYAHEGSNVDAFDTSGVYINTEMDKEIIMLLKGSLSDIMVKLAPSI